MQPHTVFDALQLAVSPVILISACGLLLLSMTNRLGRAIDRAHWLVREPNPHSHIQIKILVQRSRWIRSSILFISLAILFTAVLVVVLFISVSLAIRIELIAGLFLLSMLSLVISLGYFIADIFGSLRGMSADITSLEGAGSPGATPEANAGKPLATARSSV